jgi:TolB-like protein/Tfp pilus assembly protein PilF
MPVDRVYEFGPYRLDTDGPILLREGTHVPLPPKVAELLVALIQAEGAVVTKEQLLQRLWPDVVVEEGNLASQVSMLRKALEEAPNGQRFVENLPKRGYRFAARLRHALRTPVGNAERIMLLVLPFESIGTGERYDYFSEGLTEEIITELARLSSERLGVIARTSAMLFKATTKSIKEIGGDVGVSHVMEGSVRRDGERVRVTAQLIRAADESHLWAESYERGLHDMLAVQAGIARAVAREVQVKLAPHQERRLDISRSRSIDPRAYESYLRGRHLWYRRTEEGMRRSIECFAEALSIEPTLAAAHDGISDAHTMLACRGITPASESFYEAKRAAREAMRLDPELGAAHASLAHVRLHDWDWVELEGDFRRALELDPGYAIAHYWYAEYLMAMGRTAEAVARVRHASELDPLNSVISASVGMIRYLAHDYEGALSTLRRGLEIDPTHYVSHLRAGLAYLQKGMLEEALAGMQRAVDLSAGSTEALAGLAQAYGVRGDRMAMERIVQQLLHAGRYVSPYNVARAYAASGDNPRALEWLEKAFHEHNPDLIELTREPSFSNLRSEPKFRELAHRIGWLRL